MNVTTRLWKEDTWVRPFLGRYRKTLAASLALGILALVFAVGLMFTSGYLISDSAEQPSLGVYALFGVLGFVQIFGIVKPFLTYKERLVSHDWVLRMTSRLRVGLYNSAERKGVFYTATNRMGDMLGLLAGDIGHVQNLYLRTVFPLFTAWVLLALVVAFLGAFDAVFALGMLLGLGTLCFLFPLVSVLANGARQMRAKQLSNNAYIAAYDAVAGISDWVFSQRRGDFERSIMALDERAAKVDGSMSRFSRWRDLSAQAVFCACSLAVLGWAALQFGDVSQHVAASGSDGRPADWIAAFVLGFFPLMEAFAPLSDAAVSANAHVDSVARLNGLGDAREYMELDQGSEEGQAAEGTRVVKGNGVSSPSTPRALHPTGSSSRTDTASCLDLAICEASFQHAESAYPQLDCVSLSIPHGQHVAILGPSGAGKSTLLALLRGDLAPTSGSVTLGGVPTAEMGDAISDHIGVIQQETYLFNQSLLSNLRMGDASITPNRAEEALCAVGLESLLDRLPQGIRTVVDEEGLRFSGGERHRIAIARLLLRDTPIVLLDEPMAALDEATEAALLDTMLEAFRDRTVVMVTHHLLGVERMDRVLFLRAGRIRIDGVPADLAREDATYQKLLALDRGGFDSPPSPLNRG